MKNIKIKWIENKYTAQIYSSGVELALCSDDNEQIGTFVYCKDFFQDAIVASLKKKSCSIYGYKYDPKTMPPIPKANLNVLLANAKDKSINKKIGSVLDFINQIEKKMGVELTTIQNCIDPPKKYSHIYLLKADSIWMYAPPLLSMWTLLARNGLVHKKGTSYKTTINGIITGKIKPAQSNDRIYLQYAKPGIDLILKKGKDSIKDLFGKQMKNNYSCSGHKMHHYSGIVSYGSGKGKTYFKKWTYPEKTSNPPSICFS